MTDCGPWELLSSPSKEDVGDNWANSTGRKMSGKERMKVKVETGP